MNKIIIITGQTATGKTKLALELAQKHNGELINCDSRQIYKYLDIVTGKDTPKNVRFNLDRKINDFNIGYYFTNYTLQTTHYSKTWLYDIINPKQYFSSFDYAQCARYVINDLFEKNITPIMVGGTYFYLYHLLYGVETEKIPPDFELRKELNNKSVLELQKILKELSPKLIDELNQSELNNPQRLIRKIEIIKHNKTDVSENREQKSEDRNQNIRISGNQTFRFPFSEKSGVSINFIGLHFTNKDNLKNAIEKRVEERLKNGAIEEVKNILDKNYEETDPGLKTIGYIQLIDYLKGRKTKEQAVNEWITKEIQYAKRQYTFMKRDKNIKWTEV